MNWLTKLAEADKNKFWWDEKLCMATGVWLGYDLEVVLKVTTITSSQVP